MKTLLNIKNPTLVPIEQIRSEASRETGVAEWRMYAKGRKAEVVRARRLFARQAVKAGYTQREIAKAINRERSSVSNLVNCS